MEPNGKMDDKYWVQQLKNGNKKALSYFFDLHYTSLRYFATRLTQDELEAEDIVADCIFKLWNKQADFQTAENIKAFLYISCRNECLMYLRKLKRKTKAQEQYFDQLDPDGRNVLHTIIEAEFLNMLETEVNSLPERCSEVFKLIYFEGKKTSEIALELDLSIQTVRNHKSRALELLKTAFLKKGIKEHLFLAFMIFLGRS